MERQVWISVIIPVYNSANYLDACISSIMDQTLENWELILVDDGSTDDSGIILDTYAEDDNRIKVIHTDNGGAAKARNLGIKNATGEWIAFVDSDDTLEKGYLEYLLSLRNEFKTDIAICGYKNVYPDKKEYLTDKDKALKELAMRNEHNHHEERFLLTGKEAMEDLLYQRHFMSVPWGMISRRGLWEKVSFPENTEAEDMGTIYKLMFYAKRVAYGGLKLYNYYQRSTNTMFSTSVTRNRAYYKHSCQMIAFVKANAPELINSAYSRHFSACFQILSETPNTKANKEFIKRIYRDIRKCQNVIIGDNNGKMRNRTAAVLSLPSVGLLHTALRGYYRVKVSRKL